MDKQLISYLTLRKLIGILGILLSPVLIIGNLIFGWGVEQSISAYYFTVMRDIMVGTLVVTGAFLLTYKGYDLKDTIISSISGVSIMLVALVPAGNIIHAISAVIFFLSIAYMSYFQFTKGKTDHDWIYEVAGLVIIGCIIVWIPARLLNIPYSTLIIETVMMITFGTAWLVKGRSYE